MTRRQLQGGAAELSPTAAPCDELRADTTWTALGGWRDGKGWAFDLSMRFDTVAPGGGVTAVWGRSRWTLRAVPPAHQTEYGGRIGAAAVELFRGETSGRGITVAGYEIAEDPADIISTSQYQLAIVRQADMPDSDDSGSDSETDAGEPQQAWPAGAAQVALGKCSGQPVTLIRYRAALSPAKDEDEDDPAEFLRARRRVQQEPQLEPEPEPEESAGGASQSPMPSQRAAVHEEPFLPWVNPEAD